MITSQFKVINEESGHDDSLECNRAYNADDFCDFKKRNFYAMFAKKLANSEWIRYSKAVLKDSDQ